MFSGIIARVSTLGVPGFIAPIWNLIVKAWYNLYFGVVKAIAWILDMLTQLFFIFSGMTPVGMVGDAGFSSTDGKAYKEDIVNFFLTQESFLKAYGWLCLIALALIVVFAIGKIIKQDYFERNGPRSKGPIFRNIALSFIAFICVIPVFYFLIDAAAAIAMLVMRAMGYKGGGVGTLIFNMCWDDGGDSVRALALSIGGRNADHIQYTLSEAGILANGQTTLTFYDPGNLAASRDYDPDNFGWYSKDTFYAYYYNSLTTESNNNVVTFHTFIFLFTGMALIVNLGQMLLAMVTRLYKLIALFIVAPSPISQIVLDDGQKFKVWKDHVLQEALKVVGCVMSFMLFIMIVNVVNDIDFMRYAYDSDAASSISLLESGNLTTELSNTISPLYYYGEQISWVDRAINALARCMLVLAGVGAIKDIDKIVTLLISGGASSMEMGHAGEAVRNAAGAAASGALAIGRKGIGLAVSGATAAVGLGASLGSKAVGAIGKGIKSGKGIAGATSSKFSDKTTTDVPKDKTTTSTPTDKKDEKAVKQGEEIKENTPNPGEEVTEEKSEPNENVVAPNDANVDNGGEEVTEEKAETNENAVTPNDANVDNDGGDNKTDKSESAEELPTMHGQGQLGGFAKFAKGTLGVVGGIATGARSLAFGAAGQVLKRGGRFAGTALKTGGSIAGIMAKTLLRMGGMGAVAGAADNFVQGVSSDVSGSVKAMKDDVKQTASKFSKDNLQLKKDKNGNFVDKAGNAINKNGERVDADGKVMKDTDGNVMKGEGGPVYETPLGTAAGAISKLGSKVGGAVGGYFSGDTQGAVGGMLRAASKGIDRVSRSMVRMDKTDKETLDALSRMPTDGQTLEQYSDQLVENAEAMGGLQERLGMGVGADFVDNDAPGAHDKVDATYTAEIRRLSDEEAEVKEDTKGKVAQATQEKKKAESRISARERVARAYSDMSAGRKSRKVTRIHNDEQAYQARALLDMGQQLRGDKQYRDSIRIVEDAVAQGTDLSTVDSKHVQKYREYAERAGMIDRAYRYVTAEGGPNAELDPDGANALVGLRKEMEGTAAGHAYSRMKSYGYSQSAEAEAAREEFGRVCGRRRTKKGGSFDYEQGPIRIYEGFEAGMSARKKSTEAIVDFENRDDRKTVSDKEAEITRLESEGKKKLGSIEARKKQAYEAAEKEHDAIDERSTAVDRLKATRQLYDRAQTAYSAKKAEYDASVAQDQKTGTTSEKTRGLAEELEEAEIERNMARNGLLDACDDVRSAIGGAVPGVVERSRDNARVNRGTAAYDEAIQEYEVNISRRKSAGVSPSEAKNDEEEFARITGPDSVSGQSYADRKKRRSLGGVKRTKYIRAKARAVGKSAKKDEKKASKLGVKVAPNAANVSRVNKMAGGKTIVDVEVETTPSNVTTHRVGSAEQVAQFNHIQELYTAYSGNKGVAGAGESFAKGLVDVKITPVTVDYDRLDSAIRSISKVPQKEAGKGISVDEYRSQTMARYNNAVESYNASMRKVEEYARQYGASGTKSPELLEKIEQEIRLANISNKEFTQLGIELGLDDSKE